LTIAQQAYLMRARFPQFDFRTDHAQRGRWIGTLQPTALSPLYTVEITYRVPSRPEIRVVAPQLKRRLGSERLPHVFEGDEVCLHEEHEWHGDCVIAETTVPWIAAWLYFYEVWLATGCWEGEGTHPKRPEHRGAA
jgi:hypothetical protein